MGQFKDYKTPSGEITNGEKLMRYDYAGTDHEIALVKNATGKIYLATKRVSFNYGAVVGQVDTEFKVRSYNDALAILNTPPSSPHDKAVVDSILALLDQTAVNGNFAIRDFGYTAAGFSAANLLEKTGLFISADGIISGSAAVVETEYDRIARLLREQQTTKTTALTLGAKTKAFLLSPITWVGTALGILGVYLYLHPKKRR
jgi:hypothetical protein